MITWYFRPFTHATNIEVSRIKITNLKVGLSVKVRKTSLVYWIQHSGFGNKHEIKEYKVCSPTAFKFSLYWTVTKYFGRWCILLLHRNTSTSNNCQWLIDIKMSNLKVIVLALPSVIDLNHLNHLLFPNFRCLRTNLNPTLHHQKYHYQIYRTISSSIRLKRMIHYGNNTSRRQPRSMSACLMSGLKSSM